MNLQEYYDVIVVGGGHAGTEAALASARAGAKTLLLSHNIETLGHMSCNPAIGGIGKSHLVKEVDALGGVMARATDRAGIQFRVLNRSKGAAVRATRAQADRNLYKQAIRHFLENQNGLTIFQQAVVDLLIKDNHITGVVTQMGLTFHTKTVVLTTGTFLGGKIHIGDSHYQGGRAGDPPANALSEKLRALPFKVDRLKTGTPPRIDARTIDFSQLEVQPGDTPLPVFSFIGSVDEHPKQIPCYITHTTEETHRIIQEGLHRSAMYSGNIEGVGPRYCPSIEDKIVRFADKSSHQIFVEPEGLHCNEIYPNGLSTSLPFDVQCAFIRSIKGFSNAHITRPGYAIEYDFFDPRELQPSLETKHVQGLFFAGQINGTTGYEEAAAQGLIAGLNAARKSGDKEPWTPRRDEAYIGVLIDDLITKGAPEPYRMFTSRAEYRLLLREDNADLRLSEIGRALNLVDDERWILFCAKRDAIESAQQAIKKTVVQLDSPEAAVINTALEKPMSREYSLADLLKRPEITHKLLTQLPNEVFANTEVSVLEQVEAQIKYAGYIARQQEEIERHQRYQKHAIPTDFDYSQITSLSSEVLEKLQDMKPTSVGMASRIPGITPAAISLLLVYLKKHGK